MLDESTAPPEALSTEAPPSVEEREQVAEQPLLPVSDTSSPAEHGRSMVVRVKVTCPPAEIILPLDTGRLAEQERIRKLNGDIPEQVSHVPGN